MADVTTNDVAQSDVDVVINEPRLTGEWPSITINLGAGPQGRRGQKGDAYVLTDADKQEIAGELWQRMDEMGLSVVGGKINTTYVVED